MIYLIRRNINKGKYKAEWLDPRLGKNGPINIIHKYKEHIPIFFLYSKVIIHSTIISEELLHQFQINYQLAQVNGEKGYYSISLFDLPEYDVKKVPDSPICRFWNPVGIIDFSAVVLNEELFAKAKPLINNKYLIYFKENVIQYCSLEYNCRRYGYNNSSQYLALQPKLFVEMLYTAKHEARKCYIEGCNAEFIVLDRGNDQPGGLWSKSEKIQYEIWQRGDDSRRISIVYKKPKI